VSLVKQQLLTHPEFTTVLFVCLTFFFAIKVERFVQGFNTKIYLKNNSLQIPNGGIQIPNGGIQKQITSLVY
jgi:hypothetical protein